MSIGSTTFCKPSWAKLVPLNSQSLSLLLFEESYCFNLNLNNEIQAIPDLKANDAHCRIFKDPNNYHWIQALSGNSTLLQGVVLEQNIIHPLNAGDRISFTENPQLEEKLTLQYLFCPVLIRGVQQTQENDVTLTQAQEGVHSETLSKMDEKIRAEVICSICYDHIYRCVTLIPCLHNFCASCISSWTQKSDHCPQCRQRFVDISKNLTLNNLIASFMERNPTLKLSKEEYNAKDRQSHLEKVYKRVEERNGGVYGGYVLNNKKHGYGNYSWLDGVAYEGDWINDKRHGRGTQRWPNGNIYEGEFVKDNREGKGCFRWQNGETYQGDWVNGMREGHGIETRPNGDRYEGEFVNNHRAGKGRLTWAEDKMYEGDFVKGQMHGRGKLTWPSGIIFEGDFVNNLRRGKGKIVLKDGCTCEGQWSDDKFLDWGVKTWRDRSRYEGSMVNMKRQGEGRYVQPDGSSYECLWDNDEKHGRGIQMWPNGCVFSGNWNRDKKDGPGVINWSDGRSYEGTWKNGKKIGKGKYTWVNGKSFNGCWTKDKKFKEEGCMIF